jgi:uridylate kinase
MGLHDMPHGFKRLLLKISGEVLMGNEPFGIHVPTMDRLAGEVAEVAASGVRLCLVIGGGNVFRGLAAAAQGMDRVAGDYMGMLATVMNALAFESALQSKGLEVRVQSAISMPSICETYARASALRHLAQGRVVIFAAGTGSPFFTTDTAAALRASEMHCDCLLKGTSVDGVYSADPKSKPGATRYDRLSYADVLSKDLKVMDLTAITLARNSGIPVIVFSIRTPGALAGVVKGHGRYSIITA